MGIYRYQGQRDGRLREYNAQEPPTLQDWERPSHESRDWDLKQNHDTPDWTPPDYGHSSRRRGQRWFQQGRSVAAALKNLSVVVTGGVALVSILALVGVVRSGGQLVDDLYARLTAPQPEPKVDMNPILVQQLQGASELTTAVFAMQTVVPASRDRTFGGYVIGRTTLLYIAYGEVRAGVDLSSLTPEDVQVSDDTVTVRLPSPQILDTKIDVTRSKVYDYDRGFLGLGPDAAPELQDLAEEATLQQIVEAACTQGVLQTANERAKLTVSELMMTAGFSAPIVEVQPPATDACLAAAQSPEGLDSLPEERIEGEVPSVPGAPNPPGTPEVLSVPSAPALPEN